MPSCSSTHQVWQQLTGREVAIESFEYFKKGFQEKHSAYCTFQYMLQVVFVNNEAHFQAT
jgi:hypothetical protein